MIATLNHSTNSVDIRWVNPVDNFAGVKIIRKIGSKPGNLQDGTEIFNGVGTSVSDKFSTDDNEKVYYYRAFTYNEHFDYQVADSTSVVSIEITTALSRPEFSYTGSFEFVDAEETTVKMTTSGILTLTSPCYVDYLLVAGGGAGAKSKINSPKPANGGNTILQFDTNNIVALGGISGQSGTEKEKPNNGPLGGDAITPAGRGGRGGDSGYDGHYNGFSGGSGQSGYSSWPYVSGTFGSGGGGGGGSGAYTQSTAGGSGGSGGAGAGRGGKGNSYKTTGNLGSVAAGANATGYGCGGGGAGGDYSGNPGGSGGGGGQCVTGRIKLPENTPIVITIGVGGQQYPSLVDVDYGYPGGNGGAGVVFLHFDVV